MDTKRSIYSGKKLSPEELFQEALDCLESDGVSDKERRLRYWLDDGDVSLDGMFALCVFFGYTKGLAVTRGELVDYINVRLKLGGFWW